MNKIFFTIIAIAILAVSILSFTYSVVKPFTLDEVEEARMAQKINTMGPKTFHPVDKKGGGEPLSHPLLYSYTNAIFFKFLGNSEIALRSYGVVFFILSLMIICFFIIEIFKDDKDKMFKGLWLACTLYLINPLLIQHSMLLNADNNISAFFILIYVYLFYKFENESLENFLKTRLILALVVALNFMAKEITPMFLVLSVTVYRLLNRQFKKLLIDIVFNIIAGMALFWFIWWIYCAFSNTDVLGFIKFTIARKGTKILSPEFLMKQIRLFFVVWKWPWYWVSAPFFILVFAGICSRVKVFIIEKKLSSIDFVIVSSVVMFMPYIFVKASIDMMKYQYPVYPLLIIFITWFLLNNVFLEKVSKIRVFIIALLGISFSFWYFKIGDYIITLWNSFSSRFYLNYYLPVILCLFVFVGLFFKKRKYQVFLITCLFMIYPISIGLNLNQTRDYTTAECWLNYGEKGLKQTAEYLRDHSLKDKIIYCRKDIAYYLNFIYGMNVDVRSTTPIFKMYKISELIAKLDNYKIEYFVFDRVSSVQKARKDIIQILQRYFVIEKSIGDFIILRKR